MEANVNSDADIVTCYNGKPTSISKGQNNTQIVF